MTVLRFNILCLILGVCFIDSFALRKELTESVYEGATGSSYKVQDLNCSYDVEVRNIKGDCKRSVKAVLEERAKIPICVCKCDPSANVSSFMNQIRKKLKNIKNRLNQLFDHVDSLNQTQYWKANRAVNEVKEIESNLNNIVKEQINDLENKLNAELDSQAKEQPNNNKRHTPLKCPPTFIKSYNNQSCYKFTEFATNWYDARHYCSLFQANLVAIESAEEHYFLTYTIKDNRDLRSVKGWWTAGNSNGGKWLWAGNLHLKDMTYQKWGASGGKHPTNFCLVLYQPEGLKWTGSQCTDEYNFVCEWP